MATYRTASHNNARTSDGTRHPDASPHARATRKGERRERNAESTGSSRPRSRYIPALDGLRTLAVAAVVCYHLGFPWMSGGLQGVTMFFVLSGYLITRLLIVEYNGTGRIDLKDFWIRRIRRLLPAITVIIVVTIILCSFLNHVMLTKMRPDIIPSLLFFNNWWQILRNVSYFDALGDPSPLTHFWSLAIEEQFYLIWPLILYAAFRLGAHNKLVRRGTLVLGALSALAMALLYDPAVDPSRVYYGTDTRVFSLLFGAWLAFIPWRAMRLGRPAARLRRLLGRKRAKRPATRRGAVSGPSPVLIDTLGILSLAGLIAIMATTNGYTAFQYRGGTLLCTVLTVAVVADCVQPDTLLARIFAWKPLVWLGKRSYGIYLWHYPLLLLMNPVSDITEKPWWAYVIQIALVVVCAELSYRFIETPFRHGALGRAIKAVREGQTTPSRLARTHLVPVVASVLVCAVAAGGLILVPDTSALSAEGAALLEEGSDDAGNDTDASAGEGDQPDDTDQAAYDLVMIGDSVSVRTVPSFQEKFPHGYIDAAKNRQFSAGIEIYRDLVDQNLAGDILVFALGTNGPVSDEQVDQLMSVAGTDRTVVLVNTRSPQPWVGATNDTLARARDRYENARIVDWYGYSEGRNDLFDGDGTHLNNTGVAEYLNLIYEGVKDILPIHLDDPEEQQRIEEQVQQTADKISGSLSESLGTVFEGSLDEAREAA